MDDNVQRKSTITKRMHPKTNQPYDFCGLVTISWYDGEMMEGGEGMKMDG